MTLAISFNGSLLGSGLNHGYGYAAYELITAWQRQSVPVWWAKEDCPIAFSMSQPEYYDWQSKEQVRIGYTPWESTEIPYGWKQKMHLMDEIWTPTQACRDWFIEGGVDVPIRVLPHGINKEHWPLTMRHKAGPYTFLHIGSETKRKGGLMAYEAFKQAFGDDTDYKLVLKGDPQFEVDCSSNVTVVREYLSQSDLTALYLTSHALVYPTMGEGFGLIPFQAAATGMPTLCTDWGGPQDFMEYMWPIGVERLIECDYEPHRGQWAEPRIEDVVLWMQYFADSPDYFFHKAHIKGAKLQAKYSWDQVGKLSLEWLKECLKSYRY